MNQAAFSNKLTCPHLVGEGLCGADSWKFVERISPFRIRYRCKKCGGTIQYDYSEKLDHPYAVFGKSKWQQIVDSWKRARTLKSKGDSNGKVSL
jgi:transposase-like protein